MRYLYTTLKEAGLRYSPRHGTNLLKVLNDLDLDTEIDDATIIETYFEYNRTMESNCDSVAQGLLAILATICSHRPHLAKELLTAPLQSLYYLGIEDLEDVKRYLSWFVSFDEPYLGKAPEFAYTWLNEFMKNNDKIIVEAFRKMYLEEDNEWRDTEPAILQKSGF